MKTAVHILNCAPTRSLNGKTPYEAWYRRRNKVHYFHTFGYVVHVKKVGPSMTKLSDRSMPMVLLGYEERSKAYHVYGLKTKKPHITRDVVFEEEKKWDWEAACTDSVPGNIDTFTLEYTTKHVASGALVDDVASEPATRPASVAPQVVEPRTPLTPAAAAPSGVQWATPPTNASLDSDGAPRRYRTVSNVYDMTSIHNNEYSGLYLLATEEPLASNKC